MKKLYLLFLMMTTCLMFGQIGALDPNFFTNNTGAIKGFNGTVTQVVKQSDGKLLCIGNFSKYAVTTANGIIRLNADLTVDTTFQIPNFTWFVNSSDSPASVYSVALQADGKILVSGNFTKINNAATKQLIRLNADGTKDNSFVVENFSAGFSYVYDIVVMSDSRIAIGGSFTNYGGVMSNRLAILSNTGALDTSFDLNSTVFNERVSKIKVVKENNVFKIYASGYFSKGIVKMNVDGTKDTSFDVGTGSDTQNFTNFDIGSNGRIVIVGSFTSFNGEAKKNIVRVMSNGSVDPTFNLSGTGFSGLLNSVQINSDNSMLVTGNYTNYNSIPVNRIAKLNNDGTLNTSTFGDTKTNATISGFLADNNKYLIYGDFTSTGGYNSSRLALLNADGTKDTSFTIPASGLDAEVVKAVKQNDGKLILIGRFNYLDNSLTRGIVRMNADGTLDTTFNSGSGFDGDVNSVAIDKNGKIIVGGKFTSYNGVMMNNLVRLNANGSLDTTFNIGIGTNDVIYAIDADADAKVYIGGNFTAYNGTVKNKIVRLNTDGSLDTTFSFNAGSNASGNNSAVTVVRAIKVLSSGEILIAGILPGYKNVYKLLPTGNGVTNFNFPVVEGGYVGVIDVQEDGKILIGGNFQKVDYTNRGKIARLLQDGSVDNNFIIKANRIRNGEVLDIKAQSDGNVLVAGSFSQLDASETSSDNIINRYGLARLYGNGAVDVNFNPTFNSNNTRINTILYDKGFAYLGGNFQTYDTEAKSNFIKILTNVPSVVANTPQSLCPGSKISDIVAVGENIKWYTASSGGTALLPTQSLSNNTFYYVSQTVMGVEGPRLAVKVILEAPAAPTGSTTQYLVAGSTLANLVVTGNNIKWYATEDDALMKTNEIPASTVVNFETTYYANQSYGSCESAMYLAILVKENNLSVSDVQKAKTSIYPNPVRDVLNISSTNKVVKVSIYNTVGAKLLETTKTNAIDVSKLVKGIYLISISSENGTETKKFIKN